MVLAIEVLLRAFDDAWAHQWESVMAVLDGVTADEAQWQSPAYAAEAAEDGWPLPGTIWWHVAHLAYYKRYYADILLVGPTQEKPAPSAPRVPLPTFSADLESLHANHARQRAALAGFADAQLELPMGPTMTVLEFAAMTIRHDSWHAGQIALIRRLFRTRPTS